MTLRTFLLGLSVLVATFLLSSCLTSTQQSGLDAMNHDRTTNGMPALRDRDDDVQAKAQHWADKLATEWALYHSVLTDGITSQVCAIGENIASSSYGGDGVANNEALFMQSPGHRANILANGWNGTGVGVAIRGNTTWTVQEFVTYC